MARKTTLVRDDSRVSVDREEYAAMVALKEEYDVGVAQRAQATNRNHDLIVTCDAQARRLTEVDLTLRNYARIDGLQRTFINLLRADYPKVAALEDLSEFWRRWVVVTENFVRDRPEQRGKVAQAEPELFREWSLWVKGEAGHLSQTVETRGDHDTSQPTDQVALQDSIINSLRQTNVMMATRVRELEGELEAYKKARK